MPCLLWRHFEAIEGDLKARVGRSAGMWKVFPSLQWSWMSHSFTLSHHKTDPRYSIKKSWEWSDPLINHPKVTIWRADSLLKSRYQTFCGFSFTNVRMSWFSLFYIILMSTWSFFGFKLLVTSSGPYLRCCERVYITFAYKLTKCYRHLIHSFKQSFQLNDRALNGRLGLHGWWDLIPY